MRKRAAGILLHISSLPSGFGIGDFGPCAYKFADFLARAGQSYWQVLPLNPPAPVRNNFSPYNSSSAFAGNTLFISPQLLYRQGLLDKKDIRNIPAFPKTRVNYSAVSAYKEKLFNLAYEHFENNSKSRKGCLTAYQRFCEDNKSWLDDFTVFTAVSRHFKNLSWSKWPAELRDRKPAALKAVKAQLDDAVNREKFLQYIFFEQWQALKSYCHKLGIKLIGDIPFYVAFESADVWSHPELFKLTKSKRPRFVAGVPPDLFSRTGQLWNNPVYNWNALKKTGYRWPLARIGHNLNLFDIVRLDHFRGFAAYWQIPARCKTAVKGKWVKVPGEHFFKKVLSRFPVSAFIAEDLGRITPNVHALRNKFNLAGMKVLQSGFGENFATSTHNPHNLIKNSVAFTGTHDNNTIKGWFKNEADDKQRKRLFECIGNKVFVSEVNWALLKLAFGSVSNTVIIPMQDILGLGKDARMNRPATIKGNWLWRLTKGRLTPRIANKLKKFTKAASRIVPRG
ncbi:MAG: 4-alpha-glucanotransferase [Sedimentisphaerales bacterium]|nr:4-alpha-glucanotransferase [Sedimentisphaerales bacterium]